MTADNVSAEVYACFEEDKNGALVLSEMNEAYSRITGCGKIHAGRYVSELFDENYSAHLRRICCLCGGGDEISFNIHDGISSLLRVCAVGADGRFMFTGRKFGAGDLPLLKGMLCMHGGERFAGAFTAVRKYGGYAVSGVSDELRKMFPVLCCGADLEKAAAEYLGGVYYRSAVKFCLEKKLPSEFLETAETAAGENILLRIRAVPTEGEMLSGVCFSVFFAPDGCGEHPGGTETAVCHVCIPAAGEPYFRSMDPRFAMMLSRGELRSDDVLCSARAAYLTEEGSPPVQFGYVNDSGAAVCVFPDIRDGSAYMTAAAANEIIGKCVCTGEFLTEQEHRIMSLAAEGMTDRAIALSLKINESCVKRSIFEGCRKLNVSSRQEMACRMTAGII